MAKHILVVDDDSLMRRSISFKLEQNGYDTSTAETAEAALDMARHNQPDLVLLDIGLPGMDGLEALRHFQQEVDTPVIFVTARRRELDTILGLELGADGYITKPFNMDVLLAHVKAVLRRAGKETAAAATPQTHTVGDMIIDAAAHTVTIGEKVLGDLPPREFALLNVLAADSPNVVSVDNILNRVWGAEFMGEPQGVYVHIRWLREKIEADPKHPQRIITVRGVGYKLVAQ
ncbi:MAG: response regulator transcription factor [Chloroflexi bacterium]|nr:response regulator transcription factor [Chloroflexota bacterium]